MTRWPGPVVAYIDVLYTLFIVCLSLMAEPTTPATMGDKPVCQLAVDATWQADLPVDVDLWVKAPGDRPVGYSDKDGAVFNLVRDDLGTIYASDKENSERSCARFIPDGEYVVNVHLYNYSSPLPIAVSVVVSFVDPSSARMTEMLRKDVSLTHSNQELTVIRWKMKEGHLVTGSENDIPIGLREAKQ